MCICVFLYSCIYVICVFVYLCIFVFLHLCICVICVFVYLCLCIESSGSGAGSTVWTMWSATCLSSLHDNLLCKVFDGDPCNINVVPTIWGQFKNIYEQFTIKRKEFLYLNDVMIIIFRHWKECSTPGERSSSDQRADRQLWGWTTF